MQIYLDLPSAPYFVRPDNRSVAVLVEMKEGEVILALDHEPMLVAAGRRGGRRTGGDRLPPNRFRKGVFRHRDTGIRKSLQWLAARIEYPESVPIESDGGFDFLILTICLEIQYGL